MSLFDSFNLLKLPTAPIPNLFNAVSLPTYPFAKIGITYEGYPALLIEPIGDSQPFAQRNIRLKNLELTHNIECRISGTGETRIEVFTIIIFKNNGTELRRYFLSISETLLQSLSNNPSQGEIAQALKGFIEIFKSLSEPPRKTIHGLWSELLVIDTGKDPQILLAHWHSHPEEKFDFNAGMEKIEVKSSSTLERVHFFSSEQLNPGIGMQVLIASIFVKQSSNGLSVSDLASSIQQKVSSSVLLEKLFKVISETLGSTLEQSIRLKFDYSLAKSSLRFYRHQDIYKIKKANIPKQVSEVKFKSDLSNLVPVDLKVIIRNSKLFNAI